ncbi:hypothetical protein GHO45_11040 [Pseudomonas sp. FSL R10-0765]|uniref:hypothetical protein n=1 Tax=Pseudomonas sp. FSL R10-0765 TaxID=2662195 RepID=UPI001295DE3A|nr:hypothetical protein [Pseudomonas sp. FSL R10-0765]MQT41459.1 hypothetical protein [Pseudomonas sp. FSL R10-0765]
MSEVSLSQERHLVFKTPISIHPEASASSFFVVIDAPNAVRKRFMKAVLNHINAISYNGVFKVYDSVVARVIVESFIRDNCTPESNLHGYSDGRIYKLN